jgi:hypothetical protein
MQHGMPPFLQHAASASKPETNPRLAPASDAFVLSTLFFLWFLIGCFVVWAWLIWRRQKNPPPHQRLLMELEDDDARAAGDPHPEARPQPPLREEEQPAPWERPADWWRK